MALIRFGSGIADARGSIESTVFSKNRYGNYMRNRTTPVNPQSVRQQGVRTDLSSLVDRWSNTLTQAQRDGWNTYAANVPTTNKLGETIKLSGYNWYVGNNTAMLQAGGVIVDDAPTNFTRVGADATYAVALSEATQLISVTFDNTLPWANDDNGWMLISMSLPVNGGREYVQSSFRVAGAIEGDGTTPPTSPATIAVPYPVAAGQKVTVTARIIEEDGRTSQKFQSTVSVAA